LIAFRVDFRYSSRRMAITQNYLERVPGQAPKTSGQDVKTVGPETTCPKLRRDDIG
jgi:hypothetical protein